MDMTLITILTSIFQVFSVSLGVGSSTLAITNFFVAIADGKIDETERRMMGVVYVVLRIAMVAILITTLILFVLDFMQAGNLSALSDFTYAFLIPLTVLFINAVLMTLHLMPSTFGPSIQAGSWYTLGTLMALKSLGITDFSLTIFLLAYVTWLVLATSIVNGIMAILKAHKHGLLKK